MHVKIAQIDYPIKRAEAFRFGSPYRIVDLRFGSPYRIVDLGYFNMHF